MEVKLAQIMMESVIKMTTLTDANIFILIESGNKRFYGGKEHLCDAFDNARLVPSSQDVHLQANLALSCLTAQVHEVPERELGLNDGDDPRDEDYQLDSPPKKVHRFNKVRPLGNTGQSYKPPKITRQSLGSAYGKRKSDSPISKQKIRKKSGKQKMKTARNCVPTTPGPDDSENGADVAKIKCELIDDSFIEDGSASNGKEEHEDSHANDDEKTEGDGRYEDDDDVIANGDAEWCPLDSGSMDLQLIREQLRGGDLKSLEYVLSFSEMDKLQRFDSKERKIMMSVFRSIGVLFVGSYEPDEGDKFEAKHHKALFDRIWVMFPNLRPYDNLSIERNQGKERACLISRCRDSFLQPFRKKSYKLGKRYQ